MRVYILLVITSFCLTACGGMYVYPSSSINEKHLRDSEDLKNIVLGLKHTKGMNYGWGRKPSAPSDMDSLILALNEHKIFKEVGYFHDLKNNPDVILDQYRDTKPEFRGMHGEAGGGLCNIYLSILTLFIVPMYCDVDEEVKFTLTNPNNKECNTEVNFHRSVSEITGWVAPLFYATPNWYSKSTDERNDVYSIRYKEYAVSKIVENRRSFVEIAKCK